MKHLTMDTLAVQLTLPTAKRVADFHRQVIAHVGRTNKAPRVVTTFGASLFRDIRL